MKSRDADAIAKQAAAVTAAAQRAVDRAIETHKRLGHSIAVWENGAVRVVPAEEIDGAATAQTIANGLPPNTASSSNDLGSRVRRREAAAYVLSDVALLEAFQGLGRPSELAAKVEWWLTSGYSAERWIQFEFAFALQRVLDRRYDGEFLVYPEHFNNHSHVDISILWIGGRSYDNVVANVELKVPGNWYTNEKLFCGICEDVEKVDRYDVPSIALCCWVVVAPRGSCQWKYEWIGNRIRARRAPAAGIAFDKLDDRVREGCSVLHPIPPPLQLHTSEFDLLQLRLYCHRNALAEALCA